jgi:NAD(P)-dependent dehydrogenase (short-subunit alcohol dehydrogenase family)
MNFTNATVMITGAAGNLGRAVAQAFAQQGAKLVLVDRSAQALEAAFGAQREGTTLVATDLLDRQQTQADVASALQRTGGIDALCHLAGGFTMGEKVHETSEQAWNFMLDINARTFLHITHALVPSMLERGNGRIVAVGAYAAQKGAAGMGAYIASKSALIRLVEAMSAELRERNINVNCVLPTIIDTPANRAAMPDADPKRWVAPEALADAIVFLASPAARAIHGAALPVTGLS